MIESKLGQRLMGVFLVGVGGWFSIWELNTARNEGHYHNAAILFPAAVVCGIGIILFPIDVERLKEEHGVEELKPTFSQLPVEHKVFGILAVAAALGYWYLLANA